MDGCDTSCAADHSAVLCRLWDSSRPARQYRPPAQRESTFQRADDDHEYAAALDHFDSIWNAGRAQLQCAVIIAGAGLFDFFSRRVGPGNENARLSSNGPLRWNAGWRET